MNIFDVLILSVVEGITEFLPISSTGHLVLAANLLHIEQTPFVKSFEIIIQLGAILAIVSLYWKQLIKGIALWQRILIAFIPTGILGLIFYSFIKHYLLGNIMVTLLSLFIGGIILIILEKTYKEKNQTLDDISSLPLRKAIMIGLFQAISMVPGVSRAAATILGGIFLGMKRKTAVEFSFLLAIPTMGAATALDLLDSKLSLSGYEFFLLATGCVASFIVALITVKFFLKFVQTHTFIPFGIYRIIFSLLYFLFFI